MPGDKQRTSTEMKKIIQLLCRTPTDFSNETTSTSLYNNACWPFVTDQRSCPYKCFSATVMNLLWMLRIIIFFPDLLLILLAQVSNWPMLVNKFLLEWLSYGFDEEKAEGNCNFHMLIINRISAWKLVFNSTILNTLNHSTLTHIISCAQFLILLLLQ